MADFISRAARSWRLIKASAAVLQDDGELLLLPVLSGMATLAVGGALLWQSMAAGTFDSLNEGQPAPVSFYVWLFGFYLVQYFIIIFFNTALVGAALAWTVMTFLVVPVLAAEGIGPVDAIERSTGLLKKTWGENIAGSAGISLVMGFATTVAILAFMACIPLLPVHQAVALALMTAFALAFIALLVFGAALSAVYSATVYYYAVTGEPPIDFDREMVRGAFGPKGGA